MKTTEQFIKIEKTARYYVSIPDSPTISSVWFVLHGYAQLAKDFIKEFDFLESENSMIIAPEGLSRFYFRNKIGASWMTKEDRLNEINDYTNYLESLFGEISTRFDLSKSKINLLGFSQGVHTAVRWYIASNYHFDKLILCSSDFPGDADFQKLNLKLCNSRLYYLYGTKDDVISFDTFKENFNLLHSKSIDFEEVMFDGRHEIDKNSLIKILYK